ncbi:unnamed protein product [Paramecium pentaurelia]|uniref:Uncharacterized protein n=1 Tax=Paramecium pentaurelia TaxID=43138 RepID=A0A8S1X7A5_9CILI|nr:unnamed protein product [Paramecium pentaurelia]
MVEDLKKNKKSQMNIYENYQLKLNQGKNKKTKNFINQSIGKDRKEIEIIRREFN